MCQSFRKLKTMRDNVKRNQTEVPGWGVKCKWNLQRYDLCSVYQRFNKTKLEWNHQLTFIDALNLQHFSAAKHFLNRKKISFGCGFRPRDEHSVYDPRPRCNFREDKREKKVYSGHSRIQTFLKCSRNHRKILGIIWNFVVFKMKAKTFHNKTINVS